MNDDFATTAQLTCFVGAVASAAGEWKSANYRVATKREAALDFGCKFLDFGMCRLTYSFDGVDVVLRWELS